MKLRGWGIAGFIPCLINLWAFSSFPLRSLQDFYETINSKNEPNSWGDDGAGDDLLRSLQFEEFLGEGVASIAFAVTSPLLPQNQSFIIKFSGDHDRKGKYLKNFAEYGLLARDIARHLAPHPSIPQTLYFEKSRKNPFIQDGPLAGLSLTPDRYMERLRSYQNMSIAIIERATATHSHLKDGVLDVPRPYCFWKRLFEIMDYVNSKNVQLTDTKLWNMLLQNGEIILFDWHMARLFVSPNATKPLPYGHRQLKSGQQVHDHDVNRIGSRIQEYLDARQVNTREKALLQDMVHVMQQDHPPSFGWILDHHEYFQSDVDNGLGCDLTS